MAKERISGIVRKSNILCRASWSPEAIWEARLVALVASKIHIEDKDFQIYEIPIADILTDTNRGGKIHKTIDQATDYAMSRVLKLKKGRGWVKYNLFTKCEYIAKKEIITAEFHPDLKPHYIALKNQFAKYNLTQFLLLPSTYSQRIFEILKSWDDQPEVTIDLSELHAMLNVPPSLKSIYKNFKRLVLLKAHKDITKHTSLYYEWEPIKKGRKIVAIRFIFAKKRAKKTVVKQKQQIQQQVSKHNNKYGKIAIDCYQEHKGKCKEDQIKATCKLCKKIFPR